jgi:hypothetical protein
MHDLDLTSYIQEAMDCRPESFTDIIMGETGGTNGKGISPLCESGPPVRAPSCIDIIGEIIKVTIDKSIPA